MRTAIVSYRFPWPPYTGDRLRATIWLEALRDAAEVTLIAPAGALPEHLAHSRHVVVHPRASAAMSAMSTVARTSLPWHTLAAGRYDWRAALASSSDFDMMVVLLSRLHPWVTEHLRAKRRILDAVDSSALSMVERAKASHGAKANFWSSEARKAERLERSLARHYERVLVVSDDQAQPFGTGTEVVSSGVAIQDGPQSPRDYEFGFWGRLAYFANRDAADALLHEIWPRIRRVRPAARLLIAGADAPASILERDGRDGITVLSPMPDHAILRRIRIALFPVRFGTGQPNKVLEAAEAACAIIASPEMWGSLPSLRATAWTAASSEEMISRALALIDDCAAAEEMGRRLREIVIRCHSRDAALHRLRGIAGVRQERT